VVFRLGYAAAGSGIGWLTQTWSAGFPSGAECGRRLVLTFTNRPSPARAAETPGQRRLEAMRALVRYWSLLRPANIKARPRRWRAGSGLSSWDVFVHRA